MDQTSSFSSKPGQAKSVAGLVVVLFIATVIGGWLYVDYVRSGLEMRIQALEAQHAALMAHPEPR